METPEELAVVTTPEEAKEDFDDVSVLDRVLRGPVGPLLLLLTESKLAENCLFLHVLHRMGHNMSAWKYATIVS